MKYHVLVSSCDPYVVETLDDAGPDIELTVDTNGQDIAAKIQDLPDIALFILDMASPVPNVAGLLRYANRVRRIPTLFLYDSKIHGTISGGKWLPKPLTRSALLPHLPEPGGANGASGPDAPREPGLTGPQAASPPEQSVWQSGPLVLNLHSYQIFIGDQEIHLPRKEFLLLAHLFEHRGQVLTREQLHRAVWKRDGFFDPNALTVYVKNIRNKLGPCRSYIRTVWGIGYQFVGCEE